MKEGIINHPCCIEALDWKEKIEAVSGLTCIHMSDVLACDMFTLEELLDARENDRMYFKGLIEDIAILI